MTVLTKPTAIIKKAPITEVPVVPQSEKPKFGEERIEIFPDVELQRSVTGVSCITLCAALLTIVGFASGMFLCRDVLKPSPVRRYQSHCMVPIPNEIKEMIDPDFRELPLRWYPDDVQVVSNIGDEKTGKIIDALREELDIADAMEKISVYNDDGSKVSFVHDFNDNTTGILDEERCFIMELSPELVLSPELFVSGLRAGAQFDVSRVRSDLRAALPPLQDDRCAPRPVYRLYRASDIRKRSAEEPSHDYIQFSGKHVQEIKIDNLSEILDYEKQHKAA